MRDEKTLYGGVVPALTAPAHTARDALCHGQLLEVITGVLSGFNRSSQYLQPGGVYATTNMMDEAVNWQRRDAVPGALSLRREVERQFWVQIATGITSEKAAEAAGVSQAVGSR